MFYSFLQLEALKIQHEKLEKQSLSVQARLTNLQVTLWAYYQRTMWLMRQFWFLLFNKASFDMTVLTFVSTFCLWTATMWLYPQSSDQHLNLNYWMNFYQTWQEWPYGSHLPMLHKWFWMLSSLILHPFSYNKDIGVFKSKMHLSIYIFCL